MHVLLIGSGSIGVRHLNSLKVLGGPLHVTLLRRKNPSNDLSNAIDADVVFSLSQAIQSRPDCAVIATPSSLHIESLPELLTAGIPVYIEKPIVASWEDLRKIRSCLATLSKIPITLSGCNLRFLTSLRILRTSLLRGVIGRVVRVGLQSGQWLPDWRPAQDYRLAYSAKSSLGGGVILDLIHEIDIARWLFGEFTDVKALAGRFSSLDIDTEDTAQILLGRKEGPLISISLDYVSRLPVRCYDIVGEEGTLRWDLGTRTIGHISHHGQKLVECESGDFDISATYLRAMREFFESVQSGRPTSQDIYDGLQSVELALRARKCAEL
jgi:predicted dehydrogenase